MPATTETLTEWVATATYPKRPDEYTGTSAMEGFIESHIDMEMTGVILGPHGIGKTSTFFGFVPKRYTGAHVVRINAANITPEEVITNAAVNIESKLTGDSEGRIVMALRELLMDSLQGKQNADGTYAPMVVLIDDSLQAGSDAVQNQLMQLACNWTIGSFDLRNYGCIGVFLTDNDNLAETAAKRTDLAQLDRFSTLKITANDTGWRYALAEKFPQHDLKPIFKMWATLPQDIRHLLSPRSMEHIITNLVLGNPGSWGIPNLNGQKVRYATATGEGNKVNDRTKEIISTMAAALGAPNPSSVGDPVRRAVRQAIKHGLTVQIEGKPGTGKTEVVKEVIAEELAINPMDYYWSMSTTDVEMLCVPIPVGDGLQQLLAEKFYRDEPKVFIWDEFNRPKDKATFAKLMEVTQEWTIAGKAVPNLKAQIAIQNPPYVMGRKLSVAKYNIAQADRFTISIQIGDDDIPANEWLLTQFPHKWAKKQVENEARDGNVLTGTKLTEFVERKTADMQRIAEYVLEWWKTDIDDEGREWISARNRERLCKAAGRGVDLETTKIYLNGEYAPVSLAGLRARLADKPKTGLRDLTENIEVWVERLKKAKAEHAEGTEHSDAVHEVFSFSEVSQLRDHQATVVKLLGYLPPKNKTSYLITKDAERSRFWIDAFAAMAKDLEAKKK